MRGTQIHGHAICRGSGSASAGAAKASPAAHPCPPLDTDLRCCHLYCREDPMWTSIPSRFRKGPVRRRSYLPRFEQLEPREVLAAFVPELVRDINPGPANATPQLLVTDGGTVFFTAEDGIHGRELWISDGTGAELVKDIVPGL